MNKDKDAESKRRDWLLYRFRTDLRQAVTDEGKESGRTAPKQLEIILAEHYGLPVLTEDDKDRGRKHARAEKSTPVVRRTPKQSRKDAAA